MMRSMGCAVAVVTAMTFGCGGGATPPDGGPPAPDANVQPGAAKAADVDPDDPTLITRPFTAEQIRDEWVPGLRILIRRTDPEGSRVERWTVLSADAEGADIEYAIIGDDGSVVGEPSVARSTWIELRDHAAFPAADATREWVARDTGLGNYNGWLYRVSEGGSAPVQEFFFVPELPGAPVQMRILDGDTTIFSLEQTARLRPETE
jgi:hypothetical protein